MRRRGSRSPQTSDGEQVDSFPNWATKVLHSEAQRHVNAPPKEEGVFIPDKDRMAKFSEWAKRHPDDYKPTP